MTKTETEAAIYELSGDILSGQYLNQFTGSEYEKEKLRKEQMKILVENARKHDLLDLLKKEFFDMSEELKHGKA